MMVAPSPTTVSLIQSRSFCSALPLSSIGTVRRCLPKILTYTLRAASTRRLCRSKMRPFITPRSLLEAERLPTLNT